ncbi:sigma-70 family RNA polymerase sigma factor [uncultured Alistipes sp.]|uniref:RNA polymerase sigma factor n=1 Tax=uncultured Alistipes sp. TaxID=538949 RepID=UPI0026165102|nr:sigma-70 family RNA polymerase sigma factor [uncultured Alistipes sp.]
MNLKKLSDNELLNAYLSGNENAVTVLVNRHRRRVFDYIHMMVKDRDVADDIFQETLIRVLRFVKEGRYTENGKFLSWVLRIAHNQVIDHFRQKKQQNNISEGEAGYDLLNNKKFSDATVEDKMVSAQIEADVRRLVDHLPPEQKEVVMMRYYMGLSFKEIAEQTEVSINTALGRMRYALINLRKLIAEKQLVLN